MKLQLAATWTGRLLMVAMFLSGCATDEGDRAAQELARAQKRADSLRASEERLAREKKEIEDQLRQLEEERNALAQRVDLLGKELKEGQTKAALSESEARQESLLAVKASLQASQESLQLKMEAASDSIESVQDLLSEAAEQARGLAKETEYVSELEEEAEAKLRTGVSQIDLTLDELAKEKRQAQGRIALNERRISIAEKKIEAFLEERGLYQEEKSRLMRENAPETDMRKVDLRVQGIDNEIAASEAAMTEANLAIESARNHIRSIDATVGTLQRKIERQYDKKDVLAEFVLDETERLKAEKERVTANRARLLAAEKTLAAERQELERRIAEVGEEIQLLEGRGIAELEGRKALLEQEEAQVVAEEAAMLEATRKQQEEAARTRKERVDEGDTSAEGRLAELSKQVAEEKAEVAKDEADLAKQREEVSKEEAAVAQRRAEEAGGWAWLPWVLILLVLAVAAGLYVVGKKVRSKRIAA